MEIAAWYASTGNFTDELQMTPKRSSIHGASSLSRQRMAHPLQVFQRRKYSLAWVSQYKAKAKPVEIDLDDFIIACQSQTYDAV